MNDKKDSYMYTLVEFITKDRRALLKKIDIFPTFWMDYNP